MGRRFTACVLASALAAALAVGCSGSSTPTSPATPTPSGAISQTLVEVAADLLDVTTGYTGTDNWAGQSVTIAGTGSYNNIKDIPSMWTTGEAAGTAAALCARYGVQPRILDPKEIQQVLRARGALVSPERIAELERATLPSGKTVKEFYEGMMADCRAYWKSRGEPV